jgi:membrane dipeptidase
MAAAVGASLSVLSWAKPKRPAPWIDGLSFLPKDPSEIKAARLNGMICDISEIQEVRDPDGTPRYRRTFEANDIAIDAVGKFLTNNPHAFVARKGSQIGKCEKAALFLQFQSSEPVGEKLERLASFKTRGLSILQLTHHNDTLWAGGAIEPKQSGLTKLGREGISEMNRLRMLVDVSHGSRATIREAAETSKAPILYSHGAARAIVNHPRCIDDVGIRAIAQKGGVVGIFMMSFWLTRDPIPAPQHLIDQIRHVIKIGGMDSVGISNDYPMGGQPNLLKLNNDNREGVKEYLNWWLAMRRLGIEGFDFTPEHVVIPEFNHSDRMDRIARALEQARLKPREIDKIMGGNWRRVLTDVLG